jgi:hypothetical protein
MDEMVTGMRARAEKRAGRTILDLECERNEYDCVCEVVVVFLVLVVIVVVAAVVVVVWSRLNVGGAMDVQRLPVWQDLTLQLCSQPRFTSGTVARPPPPIRPGPPWPRARAPSLRPSILASSLLPSRPGVCLTCE